MKNRGEPRDCFPATHPGCKGGAFQYWNMGIGLDKGDVERDAEGIGTMKLLGQNMAWLLKQISR